jgi:hypothetical protein
MTIIALGKFCGIKFNTIGETPNKLSVLEEYANLQSLT